MTDALLRLSLMAECDDCGTVDLIKGEDGDNVFSALTSNALDELEGKLFGCPVCRGDILVERVVT